MRKWLVVPAIVLALSLGVWLSLGASASPSRRAGRAHVNAELTTTKATQVNRGAKLGARASQAVKSASARNLSVKSAGTAQESGSESESGSENEQPGDEGDGHEDPPGDVNHECPPDCGPGEMP